LRRRRSNKPASMMPSYGYRSPCRSADID
jgi:hypothetical protein